jgi:hypothetical protein
MVNEQRISVNKQPDLANYAMVWKEGHGLF